MLLFGSLGVGLALLTTLVVMQAVVVPREERALAGRFGQAYLDYTKESPGGLGESDSEQRMGAIRRGSIERSVTISRQGTSYVAPVRSEATSALIVTEAGSR